MTGTWISGSNTETKYGNYGEKGVPSIDNYPGSRRRPFSWIDEKNQMIYVFGGQGYGSRSTFMEYMNDLWSYSIETNEWTWLSGIDAVNYYGIYGEKGEPSINNYPGSRARGVSWMDKQNNILYLFGGYGYPEAGSYVGQLNDLWSYSIETNEWTWISGNKSSRENGIYGEKGVPSIDNYPGARDGAISWIDETNQILYLFGGYGCGGHECNTSTLGELNDLWSYSFITKEWTWLSGSELFNQIGNYGEQGVPSVDNYPGGHRLGSSWIDETNQVLYLLGGLGADVESKIHYMNDFWSYSIETNEWTWISGSKLSFQSGNYGEKGVPSKDNYPGCIIQSVSWMDKENKILYLFGGYGLDEEGLDDRPGYLNHLWSYSIETKEWTWLSGSNKINQNGIYGEKGNPSIDNFPGSRSDAVLIFDETNDVFYLYAGSGYGIYKNASVELNDLWSLKFLPPIDEDPDDNDNDEPIDESGIKNSIMNNVVIYALVILSLHLVYFA